MSGSPDPVRKLNLRVGLVGYNCETGLGVANRAMYRHLSFTGWLVTDHPRHGISPQHLDGRCVTFPRGASTSLLSGWISGLDSVFAIERGVPGLRGITLARGITFTLMPNVEWLNLRDPGIMLVDQFIAPTEYCCQVLIDAGFGARTTYIPHFVDTDIFRFRLRDRARLFVHYRGWGGIEGRKGTDVFIELATRCPEIEFRIYSQSDIGCKVPSNVTVHGPTINPEDQYVDGDIAVQPSRWEGVGLQILEAMACGIPTLVPDAPPMNEYPSEKSLLIKSWSGRSVDLGHALWPTTEVDIEHLTAVVRSLHGQQIQDLSRDARQRMELRSWDKLRSEYARSLGMRNDRDPRGS